MISGNMISFGYGTIAVSSGYCLTFTELANPLDIGHTGQLDSSGNIVDNEELQTITLRSVHGLRELIDSTSEDNTVFEYDGYIFDFSNFNEESLNVIRRGIAVVESNNLITYAC